MFPDLKRFQTLPSGLAEGPGEILHGNDENKMMKVLTLSGSAVWTAEGPDDQR